MLKRILSLALAALVAGAATDAESCVGCLDDSFGAGGKVAVGFNLGPSGRDAGNAAVRIPGTRTIFVVGQVEMPAAGNADFGVIALREDGSPEPTFGGDGKVTIAMDFVPDGEDVARDVTWLPWSSGLEWRLVVVGEIERPSPGDRDFGIALLRPDGSLESSASGGRVAVAFDLGDDSTDLPLAVATDSGGRIVVAGPVDSGPGDTDWGFARVGSDLTPDPTFGIDGKAVIDVSGLGVVRDVLLQPDGKILAVGTRDFGDAQILVVRLESDGSLDTSFGLLGFAVVDPDVGGDNQDDGFAIALREDGRIAVVGQSSGIAVTIVGLLPDGTVHATEHLSFDICNMLGRALAIDAADSIVAGSEILCAGNRDFAVHQTDLSGNPDTPWIVDWSVGGASDDRLTDLLLQPDGKIVAVGRVQSPNGDLDFGAMRLWTEIVFADGFESGDISEWSSQN